MPTLDVVVSCHVKQSFRVAQVAGLFDVPLSHRASESFRAELPRQSESWEIGLITGPSGSGKSSVVAEAFADAVRRPPRWRRDAAVIDHFRRLSMRSAIHLLTSLGLGSPTAWVKPYHVLSAGQQFRCDLARVLAPSSTAPPAPATRDRPLVVYDEFTSCVDRRVAKMCAMALSRSIRNGRLGCRFVAVTCHDDIARWLAPDWVLDMAHGRLDRRRLRRPAIRLEVVRCRRAAWDLFAKHHYLSGALAPPARCYLAVWNQQPVAFCATLPLVARRDRRRITRLVTLPDFQGLGIASRLMVAVAELHRAEGHRLSITTSHPAVIAHCRSSRRWQATQLKPSGGRRASARYQNYRSSAGRLLVTFEYAPRVALRPKKRTERSSQEH